MKRKVLDLFALRAPIKRGIDLAAARVLTLRELAARPPKMTTGGESEKRGAAEYWMHFLFRKAAGTCAAHPRLNAKYVDTL